MQKTLRESFRLSPQQRHLCALQQGQESFPYRTYCAVRMQGKLDVSRLRAALEQLVERHEILRTSFPYLPGLKLPVQVINADTSLPFVIHDCRSLSSLQQEEALLRVQKAGRDRLLTLQDGLSWQVTLVICDSECHWLLWDLSTLYADAQTCHILQLELCQLYATGGTGEEDLQEPLQFADLVEWQYEGLEAAETAIGRAHWRFLDRAELHAVSLPYELPTEGTLPFTPRSVAISIEPVEFAQLQVLARQLGVTLAALLLACWGVVLSRLSAQAELLIGTGYSGRNYEQLTQAVGLFAKSLPLPYQFLQDVRFREVAHHIEATMREASQWQEYFGWEVFEPLKEQGQEPFCPFGFAYEMLPPPWQTGLLQWTIQEQQACLDRFKVHLCCLETPQGMRVTLSYDQQQFVREDMLRLLTHWQTVLQQVMTCLDVPLGALQLLTPEEQHQQLRQWNATQVDSPKEMCFHRLFEEQVECTPDAIAVVCGDEQVSYQELDKRASQLAHCLRRRGVGPEVPVGLCLERSVSLPQGLLGILKAGGAYVPLDPTYPQERLAFMVQDTSMPLLLTQENLLGRLPRMDGDILYLEKLVQEMCQALTTDLPKGSEAENLAYVIYTSGSTGQPKGVMVTQSNITHYVHALASALSITAQDTYLHTASFSFSSSVRQLLLPLSQGARVVFASGEQINNPVHLLTFVRHQQVSVLDLVPSYWSSCVQTLVSLQQTERHELLDNAIRLLVTASETLSPLLPVQWRQELAHPAVLINMFGQTETTGIVATYCQQPPHLERGTSVPIGRPIASSQLYLLDAALQLVPVGVQAEVYVGGSDLARGYLGKPELTAERFVPHPFSAEPGARLYRTGDLARYRPDGTIEFVGRADTQVKVRGYRIELAEIEAVLRRHPGIQDAVVLAREYVSGKQHLVAYLLLQRRQMLTISDVCSYLQESLPSYMIPSTFVPLDALPLTPNGKVDRRALPVPEEGHRLSSTLDPDGKARPSVQPRDAIEWQLVQIWEEVLQTQPVSVLDNFFTVGGHSLLAVRLMSQIGMHFRRHLSPETLFQHPTVAELAVVLRQQMPSEERSPLVAIQPHGSRPAFFCVHPVGGTAFCYVNLARCLGSDQPFYGLQALDQSRVEGTPKTIEEMAAAYVAAIQMVQPQGPYLLGGWSLGGTVAFEMAQQLQRQGHEVGLLAVIDSRFPSSQERTQAAEEEINLGDCRLAREFLDLCHIPVPDNFDQREPDEQLSYAVEQAKKRHFFPVDTSLEFVRHYGRTRIVNEYMMSLYVPGKYHRQIDYFAACGSMEQTVFQGKGEDSAEMPELQARLQPWREVAQGGLEVHPVPGDHESLIEEPYVHVLAKELERCLDRVCERLADAKAPR